MRDLWRALLKSLWKRLRALGRSIDSLWQKKGLVSSRYPKIYSRDRQHAISMLWIAVIRSSSLYWYITTATRTAIGPIANFFLVDINASSTCTGALDDLSSSQYLRVYSSVKTWIIWAYAICDAWCVFGANQKGRLMAATTDMVNTLFAMGRMVWCFDLS